MPLPLADQISVFILTVAIGMLAGFCFDVYRAVRNLFRLRKIGTFLGDILFWLVFTGLSFYILLLGNAGEVRFYVFIGFAIGAFIYLQLLGKYTYPAVEWLFLIIRKGIKLIISMSIFLWKVITFPFKVLFMVVLFPFRLLAGGLGLIKKGVVVFSSRLIGKPVQRFKMRIKKYIQKIFKPRG